jgi:micrococcal nuclease
MRQLLSRPHRHRPFRIPSPLRSPSVAVVIVLALAAFFLFGGQPGAGPLLREAKVLKVNDGDTVTLRMDGKVYRTRLIGIDAPEAGQEPWGYKAKAHLRELMKEAEWKVLVETGQERYDKYDRLLVYLWTKDKIFINEQMLADGYAVLFTFRKNNKYAALFRTAQRAARERKIGIWGPDGLKERPVEYKKKHPRE